MVLSIPSGGTPVGYEIANALHLPMDLIIVRKVQIPFNTEAGFGAIDPDGEAIFNDNLLKQLDLTNNEIDAQIKKTMHVIHRRNRLFREAKPFPHLRDKCVILVDDGLASGFTMLAAIRFAKRRGAGRIVVAVPTASKKTIDFILPEVDELVCPNVRSRFPFAVADAYRNWYDLEDTEVMDIVGKIKVIRNNEKETKK